jgi:hypothetical protein
MCFATSDPGVAAVIHSGTKDGAVDMALFTAAMDKLKGAELELEGSVKTHLMRRLRAEKRIG